MVRYNETVGHGRALNREMKQSWSLETIGQVSDLL